MIPPNVKKIGNRAFADCRKLKGISIPETAEVDFDILGKEINQYDYYILIGLKSVIK